jgi:hypothetical protein
VCGIVWPGRSIQTHRFRGLKPTYKNDFTAHGAETRNCSAGVPFLVGRGYIMFFKYMSEMMVCGAADTFALQGHEDCFVGVLGQEIVACLEDGGKVFRAGETDGEGAMYKVQILLGHVGCVSGLQAYVEEADTVRELRGDVDGLASH